MTNWHQQRVRERAYTLWEAEDRQHWNDLAHWFQAEREISPEMRVTFDSNEWEDVTCPDRCRERPERHRALVKVHNAIREGVIRGFICEVVATLEGLQRKERSEFLAKQTVEPHVLDQVLPDGTTTPIIIIAPDQSHRPALQLVLTDNLRSAQSIGMRVMTTLRYSELVFPSMFYAEESDDLVLIIGPVRFSIEQRGLGRSKLAEFALALGARGTGVQVYFDIPDVPLSASDRKKVAEYVAEWADGDAVSCHMAYHNDFFCTEDFGKGARTSILDLKNREWLRNTYGVKFVTLNELAAMV